MTRVNRRRRKSKKRRSRQHSILRSEALEDRRLLAADLGIEIDVSGGVHGPGCPCPGCCPQEDAALLGDGHYVGDGHNHGFEGDYEVFPNGWRGGFAEEGRRGSDDVLTIILDFNDPGQPNTTDETSREYEVSTWDAAGYFTPRATVEQGVLNRVRSHFDLVTQDVFADSPLPERYQLDIEFEIGNIGTPPSNGSSDYYYIQIGDFVSQASGPSNRPLGLASVGAARRLDGTSGAAAGSVFGTVFADEISQIDCDPIFGCSWDLDEAINALGIVTSHEIGHGLSLLHVFQAGSTTPGGLAPVMGTGALDMPNEDFYEQSGEFSSFGFTTDSFQLSMAQLVSAVGVADPDSNDQINEAASLSIPGQINNFSIEATSDVDLFQFSVSETQMIGFDIDAVSGDLDSSLILFDSAGNIIGSNDDGVGPAPEVEASDSYLVSVLEPGIYYLGVSDSFNNTYNPATGLGDRVGTSLLCCGGTGGYQLTAEVLLTGTEVQVSTIIDESDGDFSPGDVSLREAISLIASTPLQTLSFDPAVFSTPQTITLNGAPIEIEDSISIVGPGVELLTIDGAGSSKVFEVDDQDVFSEIDVRLSGMTITGGETGIFNDEDLVIADSVIRNNTGRGASNNGSLVVVNSAIQDNAGGGILNIGLDFGTSTSPFRGRLWVISSSITGNTAVSGGGIASSTEQDLGASAYVSVINSTISDNLATGSNGGGGIASSAPSVSGGADVVVTNSTLSGNSAGSGAGIRSSNTTTTLFNSIVANSVGPDISGLLETDSSNNLIENATSTGGLTNGANGNIVGVDPGLLPLALNGGVTLSHALSTDSPARDAGSSSLLIEPTEVSSSIPEGTPARRLIDGSGIFQPVQLVSHASASHINSSDSVSWTTESFGPDYFANGGTVPKLTFTLPFENELTDLVVWGGIGSFDAGDEAKILEISFSTDGGLTFQNPVTVEHAATGSDSEIISLGGSYSADTVQIRVTDNHYSPGQPGGDRVGLGEIRFLGTTGDQRGPNFDRVVGSAIDIGAFEALNLVVDTIADIDNGDYSVGDLSLREAIDQANANPGQETITFDPAIAGSTILLNGTQLEITDDLVIDASSVAGGIAIDANAQSRVLHFPDGTGDLTLNRLTIEGGFTSEDGGGIRFLSSGNLTLDDTTISGNSSGNEGGGIYSTGVVTLNESTVSENTAEGAGGGVSIGTYGTLDVDRSVISGNTTEVSGVSGGGGIYADQATVTITNSLITGNEASNSEGGGIRGRNNGSLFVRNTTISGNSAANVGAAISSGAGNSVEIHHSTIADNSGQRAALFVFGVPLTVENTIVADNIGTSTSNLDFEYGSSATLSFAYSLVESGDTIPGTTNLVGVDPGLLPLADNGGPTLTHSLSSGSPAINAGDPAASAGLGGVPDFDQRGLARVVGGVVDMGAVEANPATVRTLGSIPLGLSNQPAYNLRQTEVAFYHFELDTDVLAANGGSFVMDTLGSTLTDAGFGENDTEIALYDENGALIATNDDFNSLRESRLVFGDAPNSEGDLPAGNYYLALGAWDTTFDTTGFGVSSVSSATGDLVVNFSVEQTLNLLVDTVSDVDNGDYSVGDLSLREAIAQANASPGTDTISFDPSLAGDTIVMNGTELEITDSLVIDAGSLFGGIAIDAANQSRGLHFSETTGDLTTIGLSVLNGTTSSDPSSGNGGGIRFESTGDLTISDAIVSGHVSGSIGGAILSRGTVTLNQTTVSNSVAGFRGGGVWSQGAIIVNNSTVHDNTSSSFGGGLFSGSGITLNNSTISGNSSNSGGGGGITASGDIFISNSTVVNNSTAGAGGGIWGNNTNFAPSQVIQNSIIAGNTDNGTAPEMYPNSNVTLMVDYSLIQDPTGMTIVGAGNVLGQSPMLDALSDNGGTTLTHGLLPNSPAINAGDPAAVIGEGQTPNFDQRGAGFGRVLKGRMDIGAVETARFANPGFELGGGSLQGWEAFPSANVELSTTQQFEGSHSAKLNGNSGGFAVLYQGVAVTAGEQKLATVRALVDSVLLNGESASLRVEYYSGFGAPFGSLDHLAPFDQSVEAVNSSSTPNVWHQVDLLLTAPVGAVEARLVLTYEGTGGSVFFDASGLDDAPAQSCDFDGDGLCDGTDIDLLQANIVTGPADPAVFDLTGDGQVTITDRDEWLVQAGAENLPSGNAYLLGDANLDGFVNGADFILWNSNKFSSSSAWTDGDFNADGTVDGQDFIAWNANKFQAADVITRRGESSSLFAAKDDAFANEEEEESRSYENQVDALFATFA